MAWDPKFIGGHLEINNTAGSQVTAYSKTDYEKKSFCNCNENVVEAWWQGPLVYVRTEKGRTFRYVDSDNCI